MKFRISTAQNVAIGGIAIWATAPIFAYGTVYRLIVVLLALAWFVLEAARSDGLVKHPTRRTLLILAYILCVTAVEITLGKRGITVLAQLYIFYFFFLVYESRRKDIASLSPVFWCVVATLPIWMYKTHGALQLDARVARILVRNSQEAMDLSSQGVGGYGLVYLSVLLMPLLASMVRLKSSELLGSDDVRFRKLRATAGKLALWACLVLGISLILSAGYSIALYCMAFGVAFSIAFGHGSVRHLVVRGLVVAIASLILFIYLQNILEMLLILADGTLFQKKIADLLGSLRETSAAGTFGDRVNLYSASIEFFMENPLMGALDSGGHSAVLDQFGRYGLFVGILFVWSLYFVTFRELRSGGRATGTAFAFLVVLVPVTAFNTLAGSFGIAVYIVFPFVIATIRRARLQDRRLAAGRRSA